MNPHHRRHIVAVLLAASVLGGCSNGLPGAIDQDAAMAAPAAVTAAAEEKVCDAYDGPALSSLHGYEGLTHEHSAYSDGDPHFIPADYYRIAGENGYSYAAGSEHSDSLDDGDYLTLHASCDASTAHFDPTQLEYCFLNPSLDKLFKWNSTLTQAQDASNAGFLGIRGFEWTSDVFGHINVYFSQNFTNAKDDGGYALTMETFWNWFTRDPALPGLAGAAASPVPFGGGADGLATFNHPHDKCLFKDVPAPVIDGECDWNNYTLVPAAVERMFGIEAYNDNNREDRYMPYIAKALDAGWRLSFLGSEDEHFAQYAVEFRPRTVTLAQALTTDDFRAAWLARRTYALSPGVHARVDFDAEGHPMGSQMNCATGKTVPMHVAVHNPDGSDFRGSLHLYSDGGVEVARIYSGSGDFKVPVQEGTHWYFVRVHQPLGESAIYVAPVWITGK